MDYSKRGVDDFIPLPFEPGEAIEAIKNALSRRRVEISRLTVQKNSGRETTRPPQG